MSPHLGIMRAHVCLPDWKQPWQMGCVPLVPISILPAASLGPGPQSCQDSAVTAANNFTEYEVGIPALTHSNLAVLGQVVLQSLIGSWRIEFQMEN